MVSMDVYVGENLPTFRCFADLMTWLQRWATERVYTQERQWQPICLQVLNTDGALRRLLQRYNLKKSPKYIPMFCGICNKGRPLLKMRLDMYRKEHLPEQYNYMTRRNYCDHHISKQNWVYHCSSYCCFYSCCDICHAKRESPLLTFLEKYQALSIPIAPPVTAKRIPIMAAGMIKLYPRDISDAEEASRPELMRKMSSIIVRQSLQMLVPNALLNPGIHNNTREIKKLKCVDFIVFPASDEFSMHCLSLIEGQIFGEEPWRAEGYHPSSPAGDGVERDDPAE